MFSSEQEQYEMLHARYGKCFSLGLWMVIWGNKVVMGFIRQLKAVSNVAC